MVLHGPSADGSGTWKVLSAKVQSMVPKGIEEGASEEGHPGKACHKLSPFQEAPSCTLQSAEDLPRKVTGRCREGHSRPSGDHPLTFSRPSRDLQPTFQAPSRDLSTPHHLAFPKPSGKGIQNRRVTPVRGDLACKLRFADDCGRSVGIYGGWLH